MLRIDTLDNDATLRFEGNLAGDWVAAARDACRGWIPSTAMVPRSLRVDLAAVTYVDTAGLQLLRDLRSCGVELRPCSLFVSQLLSMELK